MFRCIQWINFSDATKLNEVKRQMYSSLYRICSTHFINDMVKINISGKRYLTTNAIPTCYLDFNTENNCQLIRAAQQNLNL